MTIYHASVRSELDPDKKNASSRLASIYNELKRHFTIKPLDLVLLSNACAFGALLMWIGGVN